MSLVDQYVAKKEQETTSDFSSVFAGMEKDMSSLGGEPGEEEEDSGMSRRQSLLDMALSGAGGVPAVADEDGLSR